MRDLTSKGAGVKKVLFITTHDMYDKYGNGGAKVSQNNYQLIKEYFGDSNTFLCVFSDKNIEKSYSNEIVFRRVTGYLQKIISSLMGCKIYLPWKEKKILKYIEDMKIDLLFIDSSILGRLAKFKGKYKTIVFYHNIETDYAWNKVKNEGIQYMLSYLASRYNDMMGTKADIVMGLNSRDSSRLYHMYGRKMEYLLPVTLMDSFNVSKVKEQYEREIMFVGSFFSANKVSIEWFIKEVVPKLNNIVLNIVGKDFETMKSTYEHTHNVCVIGSVKEIDKYYYRHAAVVMPIISGAGMKVKTAEAMMFGRVIFASNEALEGYDVEGIKDIYRCNTADEYAVAINEYFRKQEFDGYSKSVRALFENKYNSNAIKKNFFTWLDRVL